MGHWQWDYELQREHWRHWCDQGRFLHSSVWNQTKHGNIINKAACFFSVFMHTNYLDKFGSIKIIFNHFNLKSTSVLNGNSCNTYNSQNSNKCNKYNSTPLPLLACILDFCLLNAGWKQKGGAVGGGAHDAFWHFQQVW